MRKVLFVSSIMLGLLTITSCATRSMDFNKDKDIVTCSAGTYTVTKNSTMDEIKQFCNVTGKSVNVQNGKPPVLEFWTDQHARVNCSFVKGKINECEFVK